MLRRGFAPRRFTPCGAAAISNVRLTVAPFMTGVLGRAVRIFRVYIFRHATSK